MLGEILNKLGGLDAGYGLLSASVIAAVLGFALRFVLAQRPVARPVVEGAADYVEATEALVRRHAETAVRAAESFGLLGGRQGVDKLVYALDYLEDVLARAGVEGQADRVTRERLVADIEEAVRRLFPKTAP